MELINKNDKKIVCFLLVFIILMFACGCNKQVFDLNYTFDYAIIELPNGDIVEGKVQSWTDYEDGDQLQIKIDDVVYLVHSTDVTLIYKGGSK